MQKNVKMLFKLAIACSLAFGLANADTKYATSVKKLYANASDTKEDGKLLPTAKIEVLGTEGNKIKIKMQGYAKDGVDNALYFLPGKRILNAAFAKDAKIKDKKILKSQNVGADKYNLMEVVVYTDSNDLSEDLKSLYDKASQLYTNSCGMCHKLHDKKEFKANQWPSVVKAMSSRSGLSKNDEYFLTQYLQKNAGDVEVQK